MKKQALALGVGWFALQGVWTAYNAFMPLFYNQFTANLFLIGLLMTFDNIAALTLQPFWGARSDLTRSPLGRRKPYLLIGMPLAAVAVAVNWLLYAGAVTSGHVLQASLGYFINPLVNVALGVLLLGERMRRAQWAAVAIAAAARCRLSAMRSAARPVGAASAMRGNTVPA